MRRILTTYIVAEILPPFFIGLFAFTLVLLTARIVKLIELVVSRGVPFWEIAKLFSLLLPTLLETTVPMALLLGILFGCGRLSSDLETVALKACGISPLQVLLPVGLMALLISLITLALSTLVQPATHLLLQGQLYTIAKGSAGALVREKVFNKYSRKMLLYVDDVIPPGHFFKGVLIVDRRDPSKENLIMGKVGLLLSSEEGNGINLRLFDGTIHERRTNGSGFDQTSFNVYHFRIELDDALSLLAPKERSPKELSLRSLGEIIRRKTGQGVRPTLELMELHQRFAFSFAPLVFALLGIAIAMAPRRFRASRSWGVASCLFWLLAYYALRSLGVALGERELVAPGLAVWLPNLFVGAIALYLFTRSLTESPSMVDAYAQRFRKFLGRHGVARTEVPAK